MAIKKYLSLEGLTRFKEKLIATFIPYDNTSSGLTATDVQGGIDELNSNLMSIDAKSLRIKSSIPSGSDLDNYTTTGIYYSSSVNNTGTNFPTAEYVYAGMLEVIGFGTTLIYQRYTVRTTNRLFIRAKQSTAWSQWSEK